MSDQSKSILGASASSAMLIDGRACADGLLEDVRQRAARLVGDGVKPGLATVLVGADPASQVYVGAKGRAAGTCGFHSVQHTLPATTSEAQLLALVDELNKDAAVHGILVQLPLPAAIDTARVLEAIHPAKDVDGFHPFNAGLVATGAFARALVPCTPQGSMILLRRACAELGLPIAGREAVIIGRSNIVGKPMAQLLLAEHATVTIAHSRTHDLAGVVRRADIVVAAAGRAEMVRGNWLKPGSLVIDVGINRIAAEGVSADGRPKTRLAGDVAFTEALAHVRAITPVPGGVGPMTIAMLMANTVQAAARAAGKRFAAL